MARKHISISWSSWIRHAVYRTFETIFCTPRDTGLLSVHHLLTNKFLESPNLCTPSPAQDLPLVSFLGTVKVDRVPLNDRPQHLSSMTVTYANKRQAHVLLSKILFTPTLTFTNMNLEQYKDSPKARNSVKMVGLAGMAHAEKETRQEFQWPCPADIMGRWAYNSHKAMTLPLRRNEDDPYICWKISFLGHLGDTTDELV